MEPVYISQDISLLDFIRTKISDFSDFSTLANELIQNAEDAKASEITFDTSEEEDTRLIVSNDSEFSKLDFTKMERIAGGDRRADDEWSIGKFGIGFISVYLVTDRPSLISSGRCRIFKPEETADRRIEESPVPKTKGSTFILPWAKENSPIRQALKLAPITAEQINIFCGELYKTLPNTLLFLANLEKINLKYFDAECIFHKEINGNVVTIHAQEKKKKNNQITPSHKNFYLLNGDFTEQGNILKSLHGIDKISIKRKSSVNIAIPLDDIDSFKGLFYAFLPTQQPPNTAFHINADFFPSSDRKRVSITGSNYSDQWNKAAYNCAISTVVNNLDVLKEYLGYSKFWIFLNNNNNDFLTALKRVVFNKSIVWTTRGTWCRPNDLFLLRDYDQEQKILPLFKELNIFIVHPDLGRYSRLLKDLGVVELGASQLISILLDKLKLNHSIPFNQSPSWLKNIFYREALGVEMKILLQRNISNVIKDKLSQCAIVLSNHKTFVPIKEIVVVKEDGTIPLFTALGSDILFLDNQNNARSVKELIIEFKLNNQLTYNRVLDSLKKIPVDELHSNLSRDNHKLLLNLFKWLLQLSNLVENFKRELVKLPIFPSNGQLVPLANLFIATSFNDPLQLSSLVDIHILPPESKELLVQLGAKELTLINYLKCQIPESFTKGTNEQQIQALTQLLIEQFDQYKENSEVKNKLSELAFIECHNSETRKRPIEVYFDREELREILGDSYFFLKSYTKESEKVLLWLGVSKRLRSNDLIILIKNTITAQANTNKRDTISKIFAYLSKYWNDYNSKDLQDLKTLAWLPAEYSKGEYGWSIPKDIFTDENKKIFFTQARFFSLPSDKVNPEFLDFLEINRYPTVEQVLEHLIKCSQKTFGLDYGVYSFLQENLDRINDDYFNRIQNSKCIYLGKSLGYVNPNEVFLGESQFEPYKLGLKLNLRKYTEFFRRLNIKEFLDTDSAISILIQVSDKYTNLSQASTQEDRSIVNACWGVLATALENGEVTPDIIKSNLQNQSVIITDDGYLRIPSQIFFNDRPSLSDSFPVLKNRLLIKLKVLSKYSVFKAAGVRSVSEIIQIKLIDLSSWNIIDDERLLITLRNRRHLIKRVTTETTLVDQLINNLSIKRSESIRLEYSLDIDSQKYTCIKDQDIYACISRNDNKFTLYYRLIQNQHPWAHLARELASTLDRDTETGQMASALKEVISADSNETASQILDALGFAIGTNAGPQILEPEEPLVNSEYHNNSSQIIPNKDSGTNSNKPQAIEIGRWAKEEAKKLYESLGYNVKTRIVSQGFNFFVCSKESNEIQSLVNAISLGRPNIRISIQEWNAITSSSTCELVIVTHKGKQLSQIIRVREAWSTLSKSLAELDKQTLSSCEYSPTDMEPLIGIQRDSRQTQNEIILNWERLIGNAKISEAIEVYDF